jgi:hypothetical protein
VAPERRGLEEGAARSLRGPWALPARAPAPEQAAAAYRSPPTGRSSLPPCPRAEWEAAQAAHPVKLPRWLEAVLRVPGVGLVLMLILFPLTLVVLLVLLVLAVVLQLLCLPVRCLCSCCRPPRADGDGGEQPSGQQPAAGET